MTKKNNNTKQLPFVSICTPTFNRRPFIPYAIKCFEHQTYPKERMEWIIIDDGTDKIEDLVSHIPQVKYFKYDTKMYLGKKRNVMHDNSKGDIIVYMDDDDYYPPDRVQHAVDTLLANPDALCAGSSAMDIYFKHIQQMYRFGPYGPKHSTAATFAFKRELLKQTRYDDNAALAEEKSFLKDYTIPFVQLDPLKSILVFSHIHNSFDKKTLLTGKETPFIKLSTITVDEYVKEPDIKKFFMEDIDELLNNYDPGKPEHKPEVLDQIKDLSEKREIMKKQHQEKMMEYQKMLNNDPNIINLVKKLNEQDAYIKQIVKENQVLKDKANYFENKIKQLLTAKVEERKKELIVAKENTNDFVI